ncbi:hypothetical protein HK100_005489, partial [Physocladia obscura]
MNAGDTLQLVINAAGVMLNTLVLAVLAMHQKRLLWGSNTRLNRRVGWLVLWCWIWSMQRVTQMAFTTGGVTWTQSGITWVAIAANWLVLAMLLCNVALAAERFFLLQGQAQPENRRRFFAVLYTVFAAQCVVIVVELLVW